MFLICIQLRLLFFLKLWYFSFFFFFLIWRKVSQLAILIWLGNIFMSILDKGHPQYVENNLNKKVGSGLTNTKHIIRNSHEMKFNSIRSIRSNDLRWLNFEAAISKVCNCSWKFGSSPRKGKVDLCMTNGSKVLIHLTLLYFLLHYLQEYRRSPHLHENH